MSRRLKVEKNDTRECSGALQKVIGVSSLFLNKSAIDWSEARGRRGIAVRLGKTVKKSLTQYGVHLLCAGNASGTISVC